MAEFELGIIFMLRFFVISNIIFSLIKVEPFRLVCVCVCVRVRACLLACYCLVYFFRFCEQKCFINLDLTIHDFRQRMV